MKCNHAQNLLTRYLRDELDPGQKAEVRDHVSDCASCREWVAFHRYLECRLDCEVTLPEGLREEISQRMKSSVSRMTLGFGDTRMKKIALSSTTLIAIAVGATLLVPRYANAASPLETFRKMRTAFAKAANRGELTIDIDSKTDGSVNVSGTVNGSPIPAGFPLRTEVSRDGDNLRVRVSIEIEPANFSSIGFGKDQSTLVLVPKGDPKQRIVIGLDGKTYLPKTWSALELSNKEWKSVSHPEFRGTSVGNALKGSAKLIDATVMMKVGTKALVTATSSEK